MPPSYKNVPLAGPGDFEEILSIINKADPLENSYWAPPDLRQGLIDGHILYDREWGGVLQFYPTKKPPFRVTVYNLFVPKKSRKQGSGRNLMITLSSMFPNLPIHVKCPVGIAANEFYLHLGLTFIETIPPGKGSHRKRDLNFYIWEPKGASSGNA
jgi:hypothetical protein